MSSAASGSRARLRILGRVGLILFAVVTIRLSWIQIVEHDRHLATSRKQHKERVRYLPHRGRILDRNGTPLAYSLDNPTVVAEPARLKDPAYRLMVAQRLSPMLGMTVKELDRSMTKSMPTVELNKKPVPLEIEEFEALDLDGIRMDMQPKRFYPLGAGAAHVTGFVGIDQDGIESTEKTFDHELRGIPGWRTFRRDARGGRHPFGYERPAVAGNDLMLTIDEYLQEVTADRLADAVERCNAKAGWAIVLDPKTGDILAMANVPTYDPTFFDRYPTAHFRNHVLSDRIEPGSTMKGITVAAALEDGLMRPETPVNCMNGTWVLQGRPITDHEKFGVLSFEDTFVHSSNVAMAQIGMKLGRERFYHHLKKFGFGERAGVGLNGEDSGYLKRREHWSGRTPATIAFGYEIQATGLQMALAYAAFANGGILMKPRFVKQIIGPDGRVVMETKPEAVRRVVSETTARTLLRFMAKVVTDGTGKEAAVDWCTVGGKTGTARKVDPATGQYVKKYYASFIGVAPIDNPRLVVYIVLDEPVGKIYGGSTAAPAFREIINAAPKALRPVLVPEFETVAALPGQLKSPRPTGRINPVRSTDPESAAADSLAVRLAEEFDAEAAELDAASAEDALDAGDLADASDEDNDLEAAPVAPPAAAAIHPPAPNLVGMTLRQALRRLKDSALEGKVTGQGVVVRQFPAPNAPLTPECNGTVILFLGDRTELATRESR